jgi:hypothetical protein
VIIKHYWKTILGILIVGLTWRIDSRTIDDKNEDWSTMDSAAVYGLYKSIHLSNEYEYGGYIFKNGSSYRISEPITTHDPGNLVLRGRRQPDGSVAAAMYHTHPCVEGYIHEYFSIQDIAVAIYTETPTYILDGCKGDVYKFDPNVDMPDDSNKQGFILTSGRLVGRLL